MVAPPTDPLLDPSRLEALRRLGPFDSDVADMLRDIVEEVRLSLAIDAAMINMLMGEEQMTIALSGQIGEITESHVMPADWAFCTHAVRAASPFMVSDATEDDKVKDGPLVKNGTVGSYLGVPLMADGKAVGAVCAISGGSHGFDSEDIELLEKAAVEIMQRFEQRLGEQRP